MTHPLESGQHPLTDEIIDDLAQFNSDLTGELVVNRDHDMRAAADWQLEMCVVELRRMLYVLERAGSIDKGNRAALLNTFKIAMRPQPHQVVTEASYWGSVTTWRRTQCPQEDNS